MSENQNKEKTWAIAVHLLALLGFIGIPLGNLLGPLIAWLVLRKDYPLVDEQGKEAVNFQISMSIYGLIAAILMVILIGFALLMAVVIADVVLVIMAAVSVSNGKPYKYPFTIRLIK